MPTLPVRSSSRPQQAASRARLASGLDSVPPEMSRPQVTATAVLLDVDRKCVVCDWNGTVQETADTPEIAGQCPACHAPTERLRVRRQADKAPNVHAAALGRLGGLKGGPARAAALSPKRRREIARAAAAARWKRR